MPFQTAIFPSRPVAVALTVLALSACGEAGERTQFENGAIAQLESCAKADQIEAGRRWLEGVQTGQSPPLGTAEPRNRPPCRVRARGLKGLLDNPGDMNAAPGGAARTEAETAAARAAASRRAEALAARGMRVVH